MPEGRPREDMMSAFVWLDYSERERRKMLDVVDLFREHDTRDELGVGSVRDAFADMLFPGTSTIMTRARYFLLVPWTYQRLLRRLARVTHQYSSEVTHSRNRKWLGEGTRRVRQGDMKSHPAPQARLGLAFRCHPTPKAWLWRALCMRLQDGRSL